MSKKILAFILAACMTLSMTACGGSDSSDAETQSSSFSESESSESDDTSSDESSNESSEVDSEDESSKETPKKVEDSSSEDDNSSKETTTKKTETSKTTTTTKTTQAPVTQKPATTTKTTTKKTTTHTHRWVKQWDNGNGTIFYWCPDCFAEKYDHYTVTTTTTKTQPTSKTIQSNEWIAVYNKTFVTHTIGDGYTFHYDPKTQSAVPDKKVEFVSKTYWDPNAVLRGDATEIAKRDKANAEAKAFMSRKELMNKHWVSSGNDHYIDVPDKHNIVFYYYKDSNGKYAVWWGSDKPSVMTESDLAKSEAYQNASTVKTTPAFKNAYFIGTPWA